MTYVKDGIEQTPRFHVHPDGRTTLGLQYLPADELREFGYLPLTDDLQPAPEGMTVVGTEIVVDKDQARRVNVYAKAPEPVVPTPDPMAELTAKVDVLTALVVQKTDISETDLAIARLNLADAETLAVEEPKRR
jgi:hypothetical protein